MKKEFTITVKMDTEQYRLNGCPTGVRAVAANQYEVLVGKDMYEITDYPRNPELAAIAHEIGHVLASQFGLPGARQDWRGVSLGTKNLNVPHNLEEGVMASEHEAWDVSELIFDIRQVRKQAIDSYTGTQMLNFDHYKEKK